MEWVEKITQLIAFGIALGVLTNLLQIPIKSSFILCACLGLLFSLWLHREYKKLEK